MKTAVRDDWAELKDEPSSPSEGRPVTDASACRSASTLAPSSIEIELTPCGCRTRRGSILFKEAGMGKSG